MLFPLATLVCLDKVECLAMHITANDVPVPFLLAFCALLRLAFVIAAGRSHAFHGSDRY